MTSAHVIFAKSHINITLAFTIGSLFIAILISCENAVPNVSDEFVNSKPNSYTVNSRDDESAGEIHNAVCNYLLANHADSMELLSDDDFNINNDTLLFDFIVAKTAIYLEDPSYSLPRDSFFVNGQFIIDPDDMDNFEFYVDFTQDTLTTSEYSMMEELYDTLWATDLLDDEELALLLAFYDEKITEIGSSSYVHQELMEASASVLRYSTELWVEQFKTDFPEESNLSTCAFIEILADWALRPACDRYGFFWGSGEDGANACVADMSNVFYMACKNFLE